MKKGIFIGSSEKLDYFFPNTKPWSGDICDFNSYNMAKMSGNGIVSFKKNFSFSGGNKVILRATALGIFDVYINGKRIGNDRLKPGWTDYRLRVFEYEYDITSYVNIGDNAIVALVAPGWWGGKINFGFYKNHLGETEPKFACEIEAGDNVVLATDESWLSTLDGPVRFADIWDGEIYDARIPATFLCSENLSWKLCEKYDYVGKIVPKVGPSVIDKFDMKPISCTMHKGTSDNGSDFGEICKIATYSDKLPKVVKLAKGDAIIYDFGQNMVGVPAFGIKAPEGAEITCYFAEMLNDSGLKSRGNDGPKDSMYLQNYRSAAARAIYIANGNGPESYSPTFTFFGFRYIEIRADLDIEIYSLKAVVVGSDVPETGKFECDNEEINRLYSNVVWGMRGNYLSVPTDCPQRDERLGWTGDTEIFCGAASYICNIDSFMHKWLGDMRDSQFGYGGGYADVCPRVFEGVGFSCGNGAAWADAGIIVPYKMWLMYGDVSIIEEHFESMEAYMESISHNGFVGPLPTYGDWLNYDVTDNSYIATCFYAYDASLMAKMSDLIGRGDRASYYNDLFNNIIKYWNETYVKDGLLTIDTQAAYLLPLHFHMVSGELAENLASRLREKITENDYTLSTGFVGTGILNQTLAENGLNDLAYDLLLQTKDPSWLCSVRSGATTVWERWNSYTLDSGFGNVGMNSFNHYAYGAVAEWFYSGILGIKPDENAPGFKHFVLEPMPDMRNGSNLPSGQKLINSANGEFKTAYGVIKSEWTRLESGKFEYKFEIPEGTSATIKIIGKKPVEATGKVEIIV